MNNMVLKSNTNVVIGDKPMVLLPMDIYKSLTKTLNKINAKKTPLKKMNHFVFMSESSLSKDWFNPEEEKTWKNL